MRYTNEDDDPLEGIIEAMRGVMDGFEMCIIIPLAMLTTFMLIFLCIRVIFMFCCTRAQRKKAAEKITGSLRKHDSGPMFARLEEFDVLTPLQTTPAVSIASGAYKNYGSSSPSTSSSSDSRIQLIPPVLSSCSSSDSPPPPRRPNHGKTLIVPLNASRYRSPMTMNGAVGTPDSRLTTSFECGTTKSCATIPEDDEDEMDELLSIDRTSLSVYEQPSGRFGYSAYNLCLPQPMPEFQSSSSGFSPMLPAPTYSPPSLPSESPANNPSTKIDIPDEDHVSIYEFSKISDPNSPHSSSNSISDSFYLNNFDVISSAANSQIFEASLCGESDVASKFQLHRIEEESENGDEQASGADDDAADGKDAEMSATSSHSQFFPRSISQQFDMMRLQ